MGALIVATVIAAAFVAGAIWVVLKVDEEDFDTSMPWW